jgi:hypothetical protein
MLPWFVRVQDDLQALEVIKGGTWDDLSQAYRNLVSLKVTSSGLANHYGAISYYFPAVIEVAGLRLLSDTLVYKRRWDSPVVLYKRNIVLGNDILKFKQYLDI